MYSSFDGYGHSNNAKAANAFTSDIISAFLSIALFLIVVVTTISGIAQSGSRLNVDNTDLPDTSLKAVTTICGAADYKDACVNTLATAAHGNSSMSLKELLKAALNATILAFEKAFDFSGDMATKTKDPMQLAALSDCKDLLQYAMAELQESFAEVGDKEMNTLPERVSEIKNWLSAVISYQETCIDGITHPDIKSAMKDVMINSTQLSSNVLAIVSDISSILSIFQIPFNLSSLAHSLLEQEDLHHPRDNEGYPTWLSDGTDRKLLEDDDNTEMNPNVVVAMDGSGNFKTINDALKAMPSKYTGRYVIYVKEGIYLETVVITNEMENVLMYGDGPKKTIVSGNKSFVDGTPIYQTATFAAIGKGFIAKSMGFRNTAGPGKQQAVALRVQSDMSAYVNCRIDGYQGTLYAQTHRQFYRSCVIAGTIDFIFGDSAAVFQSCIIIVRKPMANQQNVVTAHARKEKHETTGFVIQCCRIVPENRLFPSRLKTKTYLGRPWKEYSRTVIMQSDIGDLIQPAGWMPLDGDFALDTLFYAEFENQGLGATTDKRVKWPGYQVMTKRKEALQFTAGPFIQGNQWLKNTGVPHNLGLIRH